VRDQFQGGMDNDAQNRFDVLFVLHLPGKITEPGGQPRADRGRVFD
jgi:hypothetical protein